MNGCCSKYRHHMSYWNLLVLVTAKPSINTFDPQYAEPPLEQRKKNEETSKMDKEIWQIIF